jgi:hypothetical protein
METEDYMPQSGPRTLKASNYYFMHDADKRYPADDLHRSFTLDQSYYYALKDTSKRDLDQVVYRYSKKMAEQEARRLPSQDIRGSEDELNAEESNRRPKVLMVRQLWLWKLDNSKELNLIVKLAMCRSKHY